MSRVLLAALLLPAAAAFSTVGWSSSTINALSLRSGATASAPSRSRQGICGAVMKGKGVPVNMRGEFQKRSQMEQMQKQMMGDDADGLPVFTIYVRSKVAKLWYPCGSLKGDARSKSLVEAWRDNSLFLKDQYKSTLDKGMAKSIFDQKKKFIESIVRLYPQLKKSQTDLEFGYKVRIAGLEEKLIAEDRKAETEIVLLSEDMNKGFFDSIKDAFSLS